MGSQVQVQVPKYGSHTRDLFRSRFPSTGPILGIYLGPGSQVRVQAQYRWLIRCMKTTSSKHVVYTGPSQVFGQTVNPILTRGADYAHHSNPSPRIFRSCNSSEYINCSELSIQKQKTICVHNMFWAGSFHVLNWQSINNLSYCGLVAARIRASDKYLLVCTYQQVKNQKKRNFWNIYFKSWDIKIAFIIQIL